MTAQMDDRTMYHVIRRHASWCARNSRGTRAYPNKTTADYLAGCAVKGALAADRLPPGWAKRVEAMSAKIVATRRFKSKTTAVPLHERLIARLRHKILVEAARRGLPTTLDLAQNGTAALCVSDARIVDGKWVMVLRNQGFAKYSRRVGAFQRELAIVGGIDDNGLWAVRVPGSIGCCSAAVEWLMPAKVKEAVARGNRVIRQGDIYIFERARDGMSAAPLPANHQWDAKTRTLHHPTHVAVHVPFPAFAMRQTQIASNGRGRQGGD